MLRSTSSARILGYWNQISDTEVRQNRNDPEGIEDCSPESNEERLRVQATIKRCTPEGCQNLSTSAQNAESAIELGAMSGIIDFSPNDQVVKLRSGTTIGHLNSELAKSGQTIPIFNSNNGQTWGAWDTLSLADCIAWNLPHGLEFQHGTWRDWVLGATIVAADGMIFKSGSSVVKSVAGYDIHRLMIGARHTLGVVAEVTMRTTPISTLKPSEIEVLHPHDIDALPDWRIQRCLRTDWDQMKDGIADLLVAIDPSTCTAFCKVKPTPPRRFESDWILDVGQSNSFLNQATIAYMKRAKEVFDPAGKLNPGEMGIF